MASITEPELSSLSLSALAGRYTNQKSRIRYLWSNPITTGLAEDYWDRLNDHTALLNILRAYIKKFEEQLAIDLQRMRAALMPLIHGMLGRPKQFLLTDRRRELAEEKDKVIYLEMKVIRLQDEYWRLTGIGNAQWNMENEVSNTLYWDDWSRIRIRGG